MKKFSKILIFALSLVIALSTFIIASSAESAPFLVEGLYRENWADAIDSAYIDGDRTVPVELLSDYTVEDGESVDVEKSVVIALNGKTLTSESSDALFNVSGENVVLTVKGPGTISLQGSLAEISGGAKLVIDASEEIKIQSEGSDSVFVAGNETKGYIEVFGTLSYSNKSDSVLFELNSGSELNIDGAAISVTPNGAKLASGVAKLGANAKAYVKNSSLSNAGGYLFAVTEDTTDSSAALIKCEGSKLSSESASFGSVLEAGEGYLEMNVMDCEIIASGNAFNAADTLLDYDGEGSNKVYKKPTAKVYLTTTVYTAGELATDKTVLFSGNITGIVTSSTLNLASDGGIAAGTRIWDGECGIILKAGVKCSNPAVSTTLAPGYDAEGTTIYFTEESDNKNFSLDSIDGVPCKLLEASLLDSSNSVSSCYLVATSTSNRIFESKSTYSSNFESYSEAKIEYNGTTGKIPSPATAVRIETTYGYAAIDKMEKDGETNTFFKFEYNTKDYSKYTYADSSAPYLELDIGWAGPDTSRPYATVYMNDYITIDFDIATTEMANYPNFGITIMQRDGTSNTSLFKSSNISITDNKLGTGADAAGNAQYYSLPTAPYTWTHVTYLMEIDNTTSTNASGETVYKNFANSKLHIYINGVYMGTDTIYSASFTADKATKMGLDSIRFGLADAAAVKGSPKNMGACFDNLIVTYYPDGYEGDINEICADKSKNLKEADDTVYRYGYKMPLTASADEPAATVDGIDYYDINEAIRAISEGSVVILNEDYEGVFVADKSFSVYTNGHKFDVKSETHYLADLWENGAKVPGAFKVQPANNFLTVYWMTNVIPHETKVPIGIAPTYDGIIPTPIIDNGKYIEIIGWSENPDALVPDTLAKVTKDDLAKGYKVYYPVYDATKVQVTFLDGNGEPLHTEWVPYGTTLEELFEYDDGSSFEPVTVNYWYDISFGEWAFASGNEVIGREPEVAVPVFNGVTLTAIKQNYSLVKLMEFSPNIYVQKPVDIGDVEFLGFSSTGDIEALYGATNVKEVKIGDDQYYQLDLSTSSKKASDIVETVAYAHFKVNGTSFTQKITLNFEEYLETVMENADEDEKRALMETMRFFNAYLKLMDYEQSAVCNKYLLDTNYSKYLSDLNNVSSLFTEGEVLDMSEFYNHFERKTVWDFKVNYVRFAADTNVHPTLTNANTGVGCFVRADVVGGNRINTGLSANVYSLALSGTTYGINNIDFRTNFTINLQGTGPRENDVNWNRVSVVKGTYNLATHISELESGMRASEAGVDAELEMARIVYAMHYYLQAAATGITPESTGVSQAPVMG